MTWSIRPFVLTLGAYALLAPGMTSAAFAQGAPDAQEFIVRFREGTAPAARGAAAASAGAAVERVYRHVAAIAVRVPGDQALRVLQQNPSVVSVVPNQFPAPVKPGDFAQAAADAAYSMAPYLLGPDQALVMSGRWPACRCASVCLWNRWMQTYDYAHRPTSRNRRQTRLEAPRTSTK